MDGSMWAPTNAGRSQSRADGEGSYSDPGLARTNSAVLSSLTGMDTSQPFNPMEFAHVSPSALDPAAFNPSFVMPRFAANSTASYGGYNVAVVEPSRSRDGVVPDYGTNNYSLDSFYPSSALYNPTSFSLNEDSGDNSASNAGVVNEPSSLPFFGSTSQSNPVYAPYGSSVVAVNQSVAFKLPPISMPPSDPPTTAFAPGTLGLPVPPPAGTSTNFAGLYSSSGFDMLSVLARVAARPNPIINIGPVDTSCSFLVVDARRYDFPIVFASETFCRLTGYTTNEIIGKNCRFLQSPDGNQVQGQPRKYTDSHAAWHMRQHISAGKESQSSLINYQKGGKAFINLVTVIPISWDNTDEIAYYVGFQVDLVDQPNAILERMRDGSYVVNYSLLNNPPKSISMSSVQQDESVEAEPAEVWEEKPMVGVVETDKNEMNSQDILDIIEKEGVEGLTTEEEKRQWHKLMLQNSEDFVHILSLKGSILYCSPSAAAVLEYQPNELVGRTIQSVCHPSDIVPVMRELKDSGSIAHPYVSLLYRVQRKHSGYLWLEATGKLHVEPGKGRKCVILVGRPRSVLRLAWNDLRQSGGIGDSEFWAKFSSEGMVLSSTQSVETILGFSAEDMVGTSLYQLVRPESMLDIQQALMAASGGRLTTVQHKLKSQRGLVDVVTRFYPRDDPAAIAQTGSLSVHGGIIAQINELSSYERKASSLFAYGAPEQYTGQPESPRSEVGSPEEAPRFQSTFKTLTHPSTASSNVFDELDTTRCTSWQYELHQLQLLNKRLRDERDHLCKVTRKRPSEFGLPQMRKGRTPSESSRTSRGSTMYGRSCANCGRTDSPEWRAGPTGVKTLCNACGLRWAKSQKDKSGSSSNESSHSSVQSLGLSSASIAGVVSPSPGVDGDSSRASPSDGASPAITWR